MIQLQDWISMRICPPGHVELQHFLHFSYSRLFLPPPPQPHLHKTPGCTILLVSHVVGLAHDGVPVLLEWWSISRRSILK